MTPEAMKLFRIPLLLALLALVYGCALLTEDLKPPQVSLLNVQPIKIGLSEQQFQLRLQVKNPNSVELPIRGMQCSLLLNDLDFAYGDSDTELNIPAFSEGQYEVDVNTQLSNLLQHLQALREGPVAYRIDGSIGQAMRALQIPFAYEGRIKLKF